MIRSVSWDRALVPGPKMASQFPEGDVIAAGNTVEIRKKDTTHTHTHTHTHAERHRTGRGRKKVYCPLTVPHHSSMTHPPSPPSLPPLPSSCQLSYLAHVCPLWPCMASPLLPPPPLLLCSPPLPLYSYPLLLLLLLLTHTHVCALRTHTHHIRGMLYT